MDDYTNFNLITLARAVPTSFANCGVIESQILLFIPRNITIFRIPHSMIEWKNFVCLEQFYNCVLGKLIYECKWGWKWTLLDTASSLLLPRKYIAGDIGL